MGLSLLFLCVVFEGGFLFSNIKPSNYSQIENVDGP